MPKTLFSKLKMVFPTLILGATTSLFSMSCQNESPQKRPTPHSKEFINLTEILMKNNKRDYIKIGSYSEGLRGEIIDQEREMVLQEIDLELKENERTLRKEPVTVSAVKAGEVFVLRYAPTKILTNYGTRTVFLADKIDS